MALQVINTVLLLIITIVGTSGLKGRFIQLNDIHYDPTYNSSGESCINEVPREKRLPYGNYDCDASLVLTESALYKVNQESGNTDFIVWAGDIVGHVRNASFLNEEKLVDIVNSTSRLMAKRVTSGVPLFPMLGNHDYYPKHQLPDQISGKRFYGILADILCPLFINESCTMFRKAGYYSIVLEDKVRVIILNSNLYLTQNDAIPDGDADPANQFQWLRNELSETRRLNQKAHVFGHVPPGFMETSDNVFFFKEIYNKEFSKILREFADVIIGVYCGHTHTDSFRIVYNEDRPTVSLLISPSITPWRRPRGNSLARNPALRVISYEVSSPYKLQDYIQYYLPLDKANNPNRSGSVEWEEEYNFTTKYTGVSDLTPQSLHNLVTNFIQNGSDNFNKYFDLNSVSIYKNTDRPEGTYNCSSACKLGHICAIVNVEKEAHTTCLAQKQSADTNAGCRFVATLWLSALVFFVVAKKSYI